MKVNAGVEWAAHACALLGALPPDWTLSAEDLAAYHDVPPAYMAKQMQALSKAGLVRSTRGAAGGYRLARATTDISLWDVTAAVDGPAPAFRCTEIRQNGPCGTAAKDCLKPCGIAASFLAAEQAYREHLRGVSIADIMAGIAAAAAARTGAPDKLAKVGQWIEAHAARPAEA